MKKILKSYSETCGPCKVMSKNLKGLEGVEIQDVDVDDEANEPLLDEWNVRAIPTIVVLGESGELLDKFVGITPIEKIQEVINGGQTVTD